MGARIEILVLASSPLLVSVAPLVGARIEIVIADLTSGGTWSLPSWERGLKFVTVIVELFDSSRSPRGSED